MAPSSSGQQVILEPSSGHHQSVGTTDPWAAVTTHPYQTPSMGHWGQLTPGGGHQWYWWAPGTCDHQQSASTSGNQALVGTGGSRHQWTLVGIGHCLRTSGQQWVLPGTSRYPRHRAPAALGKGQQALLGTVYNESLMGSGHQWVAMAPLSTISHHWVAPGAMGHWAPAALGITSVLRRPLHNRGDMLPKFHVTRSRSCN